MSDRDKNLLVYKEKEIVRLNGKIDSLMNEIGLLEINYKNKLYAKQCEIEDLLNENETLKQRLQAYDLIYKDWNKA